MLLSYIAYMVQQLIAIPKKTILRDPAATKEKAQPLLYNTEYTYVVCSEYSNY